MPGCRARTGRPVTGTQTWPTQAHEIAAANAAFPERPVETDKAWREQAHRILVGGLAIVTFALAVLAWRRRRDLGGLVGAPLAAVVLIVFQAALGMWTVSLKLLPLVVSALCSAAWPCLRLLAYTALRLSVTPVRQCEKFDIAASDDGRHCVARGANCARRLDQRELRRTGLRY